ncbi:MAG: ferrochelatase [Candidatus Binatus sp.]|uniref:ferrochelatase n=1 Tax=Candidatus Binatus sp. TaxID=2811406 RepID=UPI0027266FA6|nr:ferrochelatase [Candidatus Binatus sp.]MDO8433682.1 ferrochelatase [Candidatus Binatus sp.]
MSPKCDAVLIAGFGGPTRADEVRPFLDNVLRGRPMPRERYEEVVHHYEVLGGKSPYNELTMRQAEAVRESLRAKNIEVPISVGMRNWKPYIGNALRDLADAGARRVLGFIMAAHRSEASWERYQATIEEARDALGSSAPTIEYPAPWHNHPLFIAATASRVRDAYARLDAAARSRARLVFTAHSIPVAMAENSKYVEQLTESARLVANELGVASWSLAYQSRSGSPRDRWLEPAIGDVLHNLDSDAAVVVPIGFNCDHVEVLYDLDVEAAQIARDAGVTMERAQTVGDHPQFIEMIASIVSAHVTN